MGKLTELIQDPRVLVRAGAVSAALLGGVALGYYGKDSQTDLSDTRATAIPTRLVSPTPDLSLIEPPIIGPRFKLDFSERHILKGSVFQIVYGSHEDQGSVLNLTAEDIGKGKKIKQDILSAAATYIGPYYRKFGIEMYGGIDQDTNTFFADKAKQAFVDDRGFKKVTIDMYGGKRHNERIQEVHEDGTKAFLTEPKRQSFRTTIEYAPDGGIAAVIIDIISLQMPSGNIDKESMDNPVLFDGKSVKSDQLPWVLNTLFDLKPIDNNPGVLSTRIREYSVFDGETEKDLMLEYHYIDKTTNWPSVAGVSTNGCAVMKLENPQFYQGRKPSLGERPC